MKVRVRAVAEKNKANRALEKLIAKRLKIGKTAVRVVSGETSRSKTIRLDVDPAEVIEVLKCLAD